MQILIAGGGVIGCAAAYYLCRAGVQVTLLEQQRIGSGASSAAAGMLAPLAESREPGPFAQFAAAGLDTFNTDADELAAESGIDFEFRRDGVLRVAESAEEGTRLQAMISTPSGPAGDAEWLDRATLLQLEPALAPAMIGAVYTPQEGHVNPTRLTAALAAAAARRGANICEGTPLQSIERHGSRVTAVHVDGVRLPVDRLLLAGGAGLAAALAPLAASLPVTPVRGQMAALACTPAPIRRIIYSHQGYLVPKADGSIFVGATEEHEAGFDASVTAAGLHWLLGAAERLVPSLGQAVYLRSWAGLRPGTPDGLPILGPLPGFDNVCVAGGHYRNGILLSLITGRLLTEFLTTDRLPAMLEPYLPARFRSSPNEGW